MIERIIQIRENEGLSQEKFAKRLGLSRNFINQAENGKKNFSNRTILDICQEFSINENWLRTGYGEMKKPPENKLSHILEQIAGGNDEFIQDLVMAYMDLDDDSKQALKKLRDNMLNRQKESPAHQNQENPFFDVPDTPEELEAKYPPVENHMKDIG